MIPVSRRQLLAGLLAGAWGLGQIRGDEPESPALEAIRKRAREAGLRDFEISESDHFQGLGEGPTAFRKEALAILERVGKDYLDHFKEKGFNLRWPSDKMAVVVLSGAIPFVKFLGIDLGAGVGGVYEVEANRLVVFDQRTDNRLGAANPEQVNTLSLVHEGLHLLTFNTGLLDRQSDVPTAISEGLAMYGEARRPTGNREPGQLNRNRLLGLKLGPWIPLAKLIEVDALLTGEKTAQVAYAESWLLVYDQLHQDKAGVARFRAYLETYAKPGPPGRRLETARKHLGDLDKLDQSLRQQGRRLSR